MQDDLVQCDRLWLAIATQKRTERQAHQAQSQQMNGIVAPNPLYNKQMSP